MVGAKGLDFVSKPLSNMILDFLEQEPRSFREIQIRFDSRGRRTIETCLKRLWKKGLLLRTKKPTYIRNKIFKGRNGILWNTRAVNYYASAINGIDYGERFVTHDQREIPKRNKSREVIKFLEENKDQAFFSRTLLETLDLKTSDAMNTIRRYEQKGLIYVRGYRTHNQQTPFQKGYVSTYINQDLPRDQALIEAFNRTEQVLRGSRGSNVIHQRIRRIRDILLTSSQQGELTSHVYIKNTLGCNRKTLAHTLKRAKQLYSDIKEVKIFGFSYYYLDKISKEDLNASIELAKNYIRKSKGRDNRIGHNWEAVVEYFIDKFTIGAKFWTQKHRDKGMDSRRITLHLLRSVGDRRQNAEVDRVWDVNIGILSNPVTYVLECKWNVVNRKALDEFLEVLRWSKSFGVDTSHGRDLKQGVITILAAGAFNPNEKVVVDGKTISLAQYASRMNVQLLKPSDLNKRLQEHGVDSKITVQKICRISRNEKQIRDVLGQIWKVPEKASDVLENTMRSNDDVYEFEKQLQDNLDN